MVLRLSFTITEKNEPQLEIELVVLVSEVAQCRVPARLDRFAFRRTHVCRSDVSRNAHDSASGWASGQVPPSIGAARSFFVFTPDKLRVLPTVQDGRVYRRVFLELGRVSTMASLIQGPQSRSFLDGIGQKTLVFPWISATLISGACGSSIAAGTRPIANSLTFAGFEGLNQC